MTNPARHDGDVRLRPGIAAAGLLAGIALTGCASGGPAGGVAASGAAASGAAAGSGVQPSRSGSVSASPRAPSGRGSFSPSNDPTGSAGPAGAAAGSGSGCAGWPSGSTRTTLLITRASNGQRYCLRTGETVQVSSAGTLSLTAGSEPPRLTGTALVPAPVRPGAAIRSPAASYLAVRAGVAEVTVVRLPCRSVRPQASPATAGEAGEMAYVTRGGGAPVGAQCQLVQMLRVTIVVD